LFAYLSNRRLLIEPAQEAEAEEQEEEPNIEEYMRRRGRRIPYRVTIQAL
jgi:hypothetical protein